MASFHSLKVGKLWGSGSRVACCFSELVHARLLAVNPLEQASLMEDMVSSTSELHHTGVWNAIKLILALFSLSLPNICFL